MAENSKAILPTPESLGLDADPDEGKRLIADALRKRAKDETFVSFLANKIGYADYAAVMLWDLVVHGRANFSDGTEVAITDSEEWVRVAKFLFSHLDGPTRDSAQFNGVNIFKVYAGFDPDQV